MHFRGKRSGRGRGHRIYTGRAVQSRERERMKAAEDLFTLRERERERERETTETNARRRRTIPQETRVVHALTACSTVRVSSVCHASFPSVPRRIASVSREMDGESAR